MISNKELNKRLNLVRKKKYIHKQFRFGIFRGSIYWLGKRFCMRLEISKGWEE